VGRAAETYGHRCQRFATTFAQTIAPRGVEPHTPVPYVVRVRHPFAVAARLRAEKAAHAGREWWCGWCRNHAAAGRDSICALRLTAAAARPSAGVFGPVPRRGCPREEESPPKGPQHNPALEPVVCSVQSALRTPPPRVTQCSAVQSGIRSRAPPSA
jgi:hypothetical protein